LPIKIIPKNQQQTFIELVDKIISSQKTKSKQEIKKIDSKIDEFVFKLYGLTKEEINIIEKELKD